MIRKATLNDKLEILKIYEDAKKFIKSYNSPQWQDGYPNENSFLDDIKKNQIYVKETNNKVVAVATFMDFEPTYIDIDGSWLNDEEYIVIHRIATRVDELGKGHSKAFLDYIHKELGYNNIRIDTHELNEPMKKFLHKNGFVYCGIIYLLNDYDNKRLAYQKIYTK